MPKRLQRSQSHDPSAGSVRVFEEVGADQESQNEVLTQEALDEIRQLKHPPLAVRRTLEVMHIVLHAERHAAGLPMQGIKWEAVLRTLASDNLAHRLETFDISRLRRFPNLARDLHDFYFEEGFCLSTQKSRCSSKLCNSRSRFLQRSITSEELKLSVQRVRFASKAAALLFAWAAKAVVEALPPEIDLKPPQEAPLGKEVDKDIPLPGPVPWDPIASREENTSTPETTTTTLTVGVWATCPDGHGLCVGIAGAPVCNVCNTTISRGGDSASCRRCGFFVCVNCRKGSWLDLTLSLPHYNLEIMGMRFLRDGESMPAPLSAATAGGVGAMAVWGASAEVTGEEVQLSCRNLLSQQAIDCAVQSTKPTRDAVRSAGGVFGLMDLKALSASILLALRGVPGQPCTVYSEPGR